MLRLDMAVIVEGKYDKIRLESYLDALIIETDGFRIFADREKRALIRRLAETKGIIILTDSDAAGFKIRSYICSFAASGNIINAYIPDIYGKEKRKTEPSKEGKLGVEGMSGDVIERALAVAGVTAVSGQKSDKRTVTRLDLYGDGLIGGENSHKKRTLFLKSLSLPSRLSSSRLLCLINEFMTYDDYKSAVRKINLVDNDSPV